MGWEDIVSKVIIPAAGVVIPAIVGNRAQQAGINASKEDLQRAYERSQGSIAGATSAAQPYADWQYGQQTGNLGNAYDNALTNAQWGLDQSTQLRQQGLNNALATGQQGFNAAQGALAPYAQMGNNAMSQLSQHVLGSKGAIPQQQWQQPKLNPPPMNLSVGQIPQQKPFAQTPPPPFTGGVNALSGGTGGTGSAGAPDPSGSNLDTQSSVNSQNRVAAGGLGGTLLAGILSKIPALAPILSAIPFFGPIMMGVGLLIGKLWDNHNPDKTWASNAINDVAASVWGPNRDGQGGLVGEVRSGKLTAQQGKAAADAMWQGWINAMQNAGVDDSIIQRSIESQRGYWQAVNPGIDQAAAQAPKTGGTP